MLRRFIQILHRIKIRYAARLNLAGLPLISSLRKKIIFLSRKKVVENVNGYTMHVDDNDTLALSWHHVFEPTTTEFFKQNIKQGQTVIDIGANIGYYTLLFSGLVGAEGHVYAFEPEPESLKLLRKNLEINSISNVTVIDKAVDSDSKKINLHLNKVNRGNHQIFDSGENRETVEIQTTSLDEYFESLDMKINWIKMDIEGAEYRALQGMKNVINKNPELRMVTEIFAPGLTTAGTSAEEYIHALEKLNFQFKEIDERQMKIIPVTVAQLIQSFEKTRSTHPNIICDRSF